MTETEAMATENEADEAARTRAARAASEADLARDVRRDPVRAPWACQCPECGTWHNRKGAAR